MKPPRKAVILAAGLGTRMRPLSLDTPKPLLPFWGRPLVDHTLLLLESWGVRDVLLNLHHLAHPLFEHLTRRRVSTLRVSLSYEPEILGTGGALRRAEWFFDEPWIWMINADIVAELDPRRLLAAARRGNPVAVLWLTAAAGPRTVEMSAGVVRSLRSRRPGTPGTYTFCGLQLLSRDVLPYLPASGFGTIVEAYERAVRDGRRLAGACVPGSFWSDLGTPAHYLAAHGGSARTHRSREQALRRAALRKAGTALRGFVAIGANVTGAPRTRVENSVLWDGVRLLPGARVANAVAGRGARLGGLVSGVAVAAAQAGDEVVIEALSRLGWPVERAVVLPLAPRGSARAFLRLRAGNRGAVLVKYSLERPENRRYVRNARFLRRIGVRVPRILLDLPGRNATVIEDLGDDSLLSRTRGLPPRRRAAAYRRVLDEALRMHRCGPDRVRRAGIELEAPFSGPVYRYERELFIRRYLIPRGVPRAAVRRLAAELRRVQRRLEAEPLCLIHRDLQSTNVLLPRGRPALIDFQGMRLGPAAYDLASLLCDPYASLSAPLQDELLARYAARARRPLKDLAAAFRWAAVERLIQAIGAYARLAAVPETADFARHIRPALHMLRRQLAHLDNLPLLNHTIRKLLDSPPFAGRKEDHSRAV